MGSGTLTLAFNYPARGGRPAVRETLVVPMVVNVERSVNVNLTEMPTLIYGYRNNFCMDLGATEKVTFKCERNNPADYSDSSTDPARWSNGKWYRHLEDLFDRWQNFGLNSSGEQTGGCTMSFEPEDETLMASISGNAFLVGALSPDYSVQKMTFSLPMQLANMKPRASGAAERATLTLVSSTDSGGTLRTTVTVLKNYPQTVDLPSGWEDSNKDSVFLGWRTGSATIPAGGTHTFNGDATLVAIWQTYSYWHFFPISNRVTVPSNVDSVKVTIVGGGGGGGGSATYRASSLSAHYWYMGGGGGSGDVKELAFEVSPGDVLSVECGEGGTGGTNQLQGAVGSVNPTNGGGGGTTIFKKNGQQVASVSGGQGGRAAAPRDGAHGAGGSQYATGGTHPADGRSGGDGNFLAPNVSSNAGKGKSDYDTTDGGSYNIPIYKRGGSGGGAAAFYVTLKSADGTQTLASKGGDGWDPESDADAGDGSCGGGGGSGRIANSLRAGVGGRGCALVLMFTRSGL